MKYRYLGRSGLLVSRLCLGTMTFGNSQWGCDQDVSSGIVRKFVEGGGNFSLAVAHFKVLTGSRTSG